MQPSQHSHKHVIVIWALGKQLTIMMWSRDLHLRCSLPTLEKQSQGGSVQETENGDHLTLGWGTRRIHLIMAMAIGTAIVKSKQPCDIVPYNHVA